MLLLSNPWPRFRRRRSAIFSSVIRRNRLRAHSHPATHSQSSHARNTENAGPAPTTHSPTHSLLPVETPAMSFHLNCSYGALWIYEGHLSLLTSLALRLSHAAPSNAETVPGQLRSPAEFSPPALELIFSSGALHAVTAAVHLDIRPIWVEDEGAQVPSSAFRFEPPHFPDRRVAPLTTAARHARLVLPALQLISAVDNVAGSPVTSGSLP